MTNEHGTQSDPDATQRVPEIQQVVDRYMTGWPESDPDRPARPAKPAKPARHRPRLALLAPAALVLVCAAACGPAFQDHSDHRYDPATPLHGAGLATTVHPGF